MHSANLPRIGGIIESSHLCLVRLLGMQDAAGGAGIAIRTFGDAGINIEFISESSDGSGTANIAVVIGRTDLDRLDEVVARLERESSALQVSTMDDVAVVGVHGPYFREVPGVAAAFFSALGEEGVNVLAIASSISSLCCVVGDADRAAARKSILDVFSPPADH